MSSPDPQADGTRRATEFLTLLTAEDTGTPGGTAAAERLLAELGDVRELVFLGAGLTAIARAEGRALPTAQRAQASTRQVRLGELRDSARGDVDGLRTWLLRAGEEILFLRALRAAAERAAG